MNSRNIIYIIFWMSISFISSFSGVLDLDFSFITGNDMEKKMLVPIFIWIIAFFGDYLYGIFQYDDTKQKIDEYWTKISYVAVEIIFITLLCVFYYHTLWFKVIELIILYGCMIALKTASLYAVKPRRKVKQLKPRG